MLPLLICSLVAAAVVIERFCWGLRRGRIIPKELARAVEELLQANRLDDLYKLCIQHNCSLTRILLAALKNSERPRSEVVEVVEFAGRRELMILQRYIGVLGTIGAISPLLGLLGTVVGIIRTFALIEQHGIGNPTILAGGISEALIATASGITIAVPCIIFYRYFRVQARDLLFELERFALEVLARLASTATASASGPTASTSASTISSPRRLSEV